MQIKDLIADAIEHGRPVQLRNGRKAVLICDKRHLAEDLGAMVGGSWHYIGGFYRGNNGFLESDTWQEDGKRTSFKDDPGDYDIVGPWMELDAWNEAPEGINFLAMDSEGYWCGYTERPTRTSDEDNESNQGIGRWHGEGEISAYALDTPKLTFGLWRHSLIERPKEACHATK